MKPRVEIFYDGDCPFCTRYMQLYRLRDAGVDIVLSDVRTLPAQRSAFLAAGVDLDAGMVVRYQERDYMGSEAMALLAQLGSDKDWFNRANARLFRRSQRAQRLYPWLVRGRNLALRLLGRPPINAEGISKESP